MPTFAELTGGELPKDRAIDGQSFVPQIKGQKGNPRKWAYCQSGNKAWARTQRYKLYRNGKLFDIQNDSLEKSPITTESDTAQIAAVRSELQKVFSQLK
jgi:arylsulfatase A